MSLKTCDIWNFPWLYHTPHGQNPPGADCLPDAFISVFVTLYLMY